MNKHKENDSFSDLKPFEKILVIVSLILLVVLALSFIIGIIFFGFAGLFHIFGVHYESIQSLIHFVVVYFIVALILDFLSILLFGLLSTYITNKFKLFVTRMILDCLFSWIALHTVDDVMESIAIPLMTEIVVVIVFFIIEEAFENKKDKKE
ncbi:YrvL family regulatory protein [Caldifermentibacillus hisashii]|uniref:YrvL family regulatory protein n=1 Tax=Caldifermentibacillus hisashii TaxID=996558 RepID=UPI002E1E9F05|nr:YrvL family regulatory protein [Caldifermentibacillus hisashii]